MSPAADERDQRPVAGADEAAHIGQLLARLGWATTTLALAAVILVAASFYWLQVVPQAEAAAKARQTQAVERVLTRVETLVDRVDRLLVTSQAWALDGLATIDDPAAFNRLMIPLLQLRSIISSMHLASDDGRELLLLKAPEGFKNRLTDVPKHGIRQHWLLWKDEHTQLNEEWKDLDYDPRRRPWFKGAMETPEGRVHWTEPYLFQSTQEPGITASLRWVDKTSGRQYVIAMDILLADFSSSTQELVYGVNGGVAVLTEDGKVIGLPRNVGTDSDDLLKGAILQTPDSLGLPLLAAALRASGPAADDGTFRIPGGAAGNDAAWLATVQRIPFGNQTFRVAMMAPESDFAAWSGRLLAVLGLVVGSVAALSVFFSRRLTHGVTQPLGRVFVELADSNRELESQGLRTSTLAALAPRLQNAESFSALTRALLSGIAERLPLGQGSLYRLVDAPPDGDVASDRMLQLCGGYARTASASPPAAIALGEGLLGQCALEVRTIRLERPPPGYLRVESALAGGEPATLLVLPVVSSGVPIGVLELAMLESVSDAQLALLDSLLPMLALCMEVIARNSRTQELLHASLTQSGELAQQQERIQSMLSEQDAIFNKAPMGIMYAAAGRILRTNTAMAELLRRRVEELAGQETVTLFVSPENYREFAAQVGPRLAAGEGVRIEWPLRRSDGTTFTAMLSARAIEMAGVERAAIWIIEDISEQKALEAAIRSSEARLRLVLEASPAAVTIVSEGGEQIFANRRLAELLRLPQALPATWRTTEAWVDPDERQKFLERLHREDRVDGYETRLRRADGEEITVMLNTRWIEQDGKRLLLTWMFEVDGRTEAAP